MIENKSFHRLLVNVFLRWRLLHEVPTAAFLLQKRFLLLSAIQIDLIAVIIPETASLQDRIIDMAISRPGSGTGEHVFVSASQTYCIRWASMPAIILSTVFHTTVTFLLLSPLLIQATVSKLSYASNAVDGLIYFIRNMRLSLTIVNRKL